MNTVIGIDYGTQSARAVLVNASNGEMLLCRSVKYSRGIMHGDLLSAHDCEDTLHELLEAVTPAIYRQSVKGICVDATSLTLVPVASDGRALALSPRFAEHEHAQIKLWKRHTAQPYAEEACALAKRMHEPFLERTGGTISSEWMLPKLLETRDKDPEVYANIDAALDLCEYLTYRLTGKLLRSAGSMSYKCLWAQDLGLPSAAYLDALRPGFAMEYTRLLRGPVLCPGDRAGVLNEFWAKKLGLPSDVAVAIGTLDGHTSLAALGAMHVGDAALVVGTSNVLTIETEELQPIPDICGIAKDALTKGVYGIDSGQSCTGDMLEWFIEKALPEQSLQKPSEMRISAHELLACMVKAPWQCTLTLLDWWNGSRNAPCDLSLSGVMAGLTLNTQPQDIYLAMLQSIACGTREIIYTCADYGISVKRVLAAGGVAQKNSLLMQTYSDILGLPVFVGQENEGPALGAAIFAAVAAGIYADVHSAYTQMGIKRFIEYTPDTEHREQYEQIFLRNHSLRKAVQTWNNQNHEVTL